MLSYPFHRLLCVFTAYLWDKGPSGKAEPTRTAPGVPIPDLMLLQKHLLAAGKDGRDANVRLLYIAQKRKDVVSRVEWYRTERLIVAVMTTFHILIPVKF